MPFTKSVVVFAAVLAIMSSAVLGEPQRAPEQQPTSDRVMLILRGILNEECPRGALDDEAALGYARRDNARVIWEQLSAAERERIRKIVFIGSPGIEESQFSGKPDVLIKPDPPEGHMAR